MDNKTLEPILRAHRFFKGIKPEYLNLLVSCAMNMRFDANTYLIHEGDEANQFYLLRHGEIVIEVAIPGRGVRTIATLREGDVVGWSWLFPPYRWHYNVRSQTLVRVLALDGACLRGKCEEDHSLGYELMKRFALIMMERLQATRMQMLDVYG